MATNISITRNSLNRKHSRLFSAMPPNSIRQHLVFTLFSDSSDTTMARQLLWVSAEWNIRGTPTPKTVSNVIRVPKTAKSLIIAILFVSQTTTDTPIKSPRFCQKRRYFHCLKLAKIHFYWTSRNTVTKYGRRGKSPANTIGILRLNVSPQNAIRWFVSGSRAFIGHKYEEFIQKYCYS